MTVGIRAPRVCMVGSSNTDLVARVPRLPHLGECLTGGSFQVVYGGKGANQAVMAARLGATVSVVTRLGRDAFGDAYARHYRDDGVDTTFITYDEVRPSGASLILVDEPTGLNTIVFTPGANGGLSPDEIGAAGEAITRADVLVCQLEVPIETTLEAFRIAHGHDQRQGGGSRGRTGSEDGAARPLVILNAAPVPGWQPPDAALSLVDILVANEEETAFLSGSPVDSLDQATEAAASLTGRWSVTTIVTLGSRGIVLARPGEDVRHLPVREVSAVDTTGAGDAFVGSLAFLLGSRCEFALAVERAAQIATLTVLAAGAQPSYPSRARVLDELGW